MINENKSENNRTPEHTGQLPSGENGGLGTTYLEINITKQHLWFVKDGAVALESDFVSGKERIVSIKKQENPVILQDLHQMVHIIFIIRKEIEF